MVIYTERIELNYCMMCDVDGILRILEHVIVATLIVSFPTRIATFFLFVVPSFVRWNEHITNICIR